MPKIDWGLDSTDPAFRRLSQGVWQIKTKGDMGSTYFGWFTYDIHGWYPNIYVHHEKARLQAQRVQPMRAKTLQKMVQAAKKAGGFP
jgi:hypothetical protein